VNLLQLVTIALVQGITEFLPISSQAHLILVPRVTGWCDQGLVIDIGVHLGTLLAVIVYFWRDCLGLAWGFFEAVFGKRTVEAQRAIHILIASIPALAAGFILKTQLSFDFRSLAVIGWTTLGFGILLWIADRWGRREARIEHMTWRRALFIGCAQALALIPGTSRSGITMTAARMLGFERSDAARFSLLMAVPVILGASALAGLDLVRSDNIHLTTATAIAAGLAFLAALLAIAAMMRWLAHASFAPFAAYRVILGIALLAALYGFGFGDGAPAGACLP
jgi:undecaprenyl-diphosphatase